MNLKNKQEYEKYIGMAQAQNDYFSRNSSFGNSPLQGLNLRDMPMHDLEQLILAVTQEHDRRTMDTPLPAPTRRQIQSDEALKNAYEALSIIMKLKGK